MTPHQRFARVAMTLFVGWVLALLLLFLWPGTAHAADGPLIEGATWASVGLVAIQMTTAGIFIVLLLSWGRLARPGTERVDPLERQVADLTKLLHTTREDTARRQEIESIRAELAEVRAELKGELGSMSAELHKVDRRTIEVAGDVRRILDHVTRTVT